MLSKFHYKNFDPELDHRCCAEGVLERLEDAAPFSSTVMGVIEKVGGGYWANVDVYSRLGVFSVSAQDADFERALLEVEEKMKAKLDRWRRERLSRFASPPALTPFSVKLEPARA